MQTFVETTRDITIKVSPIFLEGQSDVMQKKFVFAYFVRIENHRQQPVQLLRRHWIINDGKDETKEVEGPGVVGEQPVIAPGNAHEYNSFCILESFEGSMSGTYLMTVDGGEQFDVAIPRFPLRASAN